MAIGHSHGTHSETTVIGDGNGPMVAVVAVLIAALVGFLIWLLAFSAIVHNNNTPVRIQQTVPTRGGGGGTNMPSPGSS